MALLTLPTINKGTAATVSLSKSELFAIPQISADAYFSVQANVKFAYAIFKSTEGGQAEVLRFDLSQASPSASFLVSEKSRNTFNLEEIVLEDFDGGKLTVKRAYLPANLDVTLGAAPAGSGIALGLGGATLSVTDGLRMLITSDQGFSNQLLRGGGFTLSKSLNNSVFGSLPGIDVGNSAFAENQGTDGYALAGGTSPFTIFVVAKISQINDRTLFEVMGDYSPGKDLHILQQVSSLRLRSHGELGKSQALPLATQTSRTAVIAINKAESATLGGTDFWLNSTKTPTTESTSPLPLNFSGNGNPLARMYLGLNWDASYSAGIIGGIVAYSRSLSDVEMNSVIQALMTKFSIT